MRLLSWLFVSTTLLLTACTADSYTPAALPTTFETVDGSESTPDRGQHPASDRSGLITAGEWNDLDHWGFWQDLTGHQEYGHSISDWGIHTTERIRIQVTDASGEPARDVEVRAASGGQHFTTRTDHRGRAECFFATASDLELMVDGREVDERVTEEVSGAIVVRLDYETERSGAVDLAFLVDATGSMGDELEFLKDDLHAILQEVGDKHATIQLRTAAVFYRDTDDAYLTRHSPFTEDLATMTAFIAQQSADGGGDFPEAVHTALQVALHELRWSTKARTRVAFLLLDAPPHSDAQTVATYRGLLEEAAAAGIHLVPIVASGIDKPTEFLMRLTAIVTNGTYVFITDDSGIGNDHLEPTVGPFEVEYLKDLLLRLIDQSID
ncbi:von Willebrand factor type A domain-containing protein [Neolewinella xylanilytica]|uniref:von Willebrand factor type A domain-containing protein n=1 Tax=Neolewinella xylanilytica TaxID=1514080 RepID=A0A2S6I9I9_9BACT|nr:vWA domain-containing protein [Neolewinella xylanilytica]PPK88166.1 von Willebrand factor type A domain-containing protein [Neolewinella xylanilytica]